MAERNNTYAAELLASMNGVQPSSGPAVRSPVRPLESQRILANAVNRQRTQRAALAAGRVARTAGDPFASAAARELRREAFALDGVATLGGRNQQDDQRGNSRIWVNGFTRADGTKVEGYWRTNPNPAGAVRRYNEDAAALPPGPWMNAPNPIAAYHASQVGLVGKVLGAAGVDGDGERARTSWGAAYRNTTQGMSLLNQLAEIGHQVDRIPNMTMLPSSPNYDPVPGIVLSGAVVAGGGAVTMLPGGAVPRGALMSGIARRARPRELNEGVQGPLRPGEVAPSVHLNELGLYSQLELRINELQTRGRGTDMLNTLRRASSGIREDELQWTGVQRFLEERGSNPVTRDEVLKHFRDNNVNIVERRFGGDPGLDPGVAEIINVRKLPDGREERIIGLSDAHGETLELPVIVAAAANGHVVTFPDGTSRNLRWHETVEEASIAYVRKFPDGRTMLVEGPSEFELYFLTPTKARASVCTNGPAPASASCMTAWARRSRLNTAPLTIWMV